MFKCYSLCISEDSCTVMINRVGSDRTISRSFRNVFYSEVPGSNMDCFILCIFETVVVSVEVI